MIRDDHDPAFQGYTWHGMPVTQVQVISNQATFTIKRPTERDGKEVGRIGFYAPDIVIKGNMIDSVKARR